MDITISDIEADIAGYKARIQAAQDQLAGLPTGRLPYQAHRKREKVRKDAQAEITHCKGLIAYAEEGIRLRS